MKSISRQSSPVVEVADRMPAAARIEYAEFLVPDLTKSLHFYRDLVGLSEAWSHGNSIALAASENGHPLVMLTEDRTARRRPPHSAGLFHLALLYPARRDLSAAFMRLHQDGWQFQGFADHGVSEALYMADEDGNGIELYVDRPRDRWPIRNSELEMVTAPLNIDSLLSELKRPSREAPATGVTIGHIHLQVTDLQSAEEFYHDTLGFDVMQRSIPEALFLAAGGYHHHIGLNAWNTRGGFPWKEGTSGLVRFGIHPGSDDAALSLADRLRNTPNWVRKTDRGILIHDADNIQMEIL